MTSSNQLQNQIDEEALVRQILQDNATNSIFWIIFVAIVIVVFHIINGLLGIPVRPLTSSPSSVNFHYQVGALIMFIHSFSLFCNLLYANHRILQDFKSHNIADVATINYKLVARSILFIFAAILVLLSVSSIIDFKNPPF